MNVPYFMEAHCFECRNVKPIVNVKGVRRLPKSPELMVAVRLSCGHERHGEDRIVMTKERKERIEQVLTATKALVWQEQVGVAGALAMTG